MVSVILKVLGCCNGQCFMQCLSLLRLHFEQLTRVPVLVLDASLEFEEDPKVWAKFITQVCDSYFFLLSCTTTHTCKYLPLDLKVVPQFDGHI